MTKVKLFCALFAFLLPAAVMAADAPRVNLTAPDSITAGSEFSFQVSINSPRALNAVQIVLNYDPESFKFVLVNTAGSAIDFWHGDFSPAPGKIILEGGSEKAFWGAGTKVAEIKLQALRPGPAEIDISQADVFYANGLGTRAAAESSPLTLNVKNGIPASAPPADPTAPIFLRSGITTDPVQGGNIIFWKTEDEGSGMRNMEIRWLKGLFWSGWEKAQNSAVIPTDAWLAEIIATDNAGNTSSRLILNPSAALKAAFIFIILAAAVFLGYWVITRFWRRRYRR